jgi:hypothetical protein
MMTTRGRLIVLGALSLYLSADDAPIPVVR